MVHECMNNLLSKHHVRLILLSKCNEFLNLACRLIIISILHRVMDNNIIIDQRPRPGGNGHPPSIEEACEVLRQKFPNVHPTVSRASMAETPTRASEKESTSNHSLPRVYNAKDPRYYISTDTLNTTIECDNNGSRTVRYSLKYKVGKKPDDDKDQKKIKP